MNPHKPEDERMTSAGFRISPILWERLVKIAGRLGISERALRYKLAKHRGS